MAALILAFAMVQQPCALTIGVGPDGVLYFDRLGGWHRTQPHTLHEVLSAGCWSEVPHGHPITAVRLEIAPETPKQNTEAVFALLAKEGWTRPRLTVEPWGDYPRKPR
jgi:hypothetical protein